MLHKPSKSPVTCATKSFLLSLHCRHLLPWPALSELDALGDANAEWTFQCGTAFAVAAASVFFTDAGSPDNVFGTSALPSKTGALCNDRQLGFRRRHHSRCCQLTGDLTTAATNVGGVPSQ
jgi:hypothetical protein